MMRSSLGIARRALPTVLEDDVGRNAGERGIKQASSSQHSLGRAFNERAVDSGTQGTGTVWE